MATNRGKQHPEIQMNIPTKIPFFLKASLFIIGFYFFISMLSLAREILLPLIYATILAILLSPVVNFLVRKKINRALAVATVLLLAILATCGLIALISSQAIRFKDALPQLVDKFLLLLNQSVEWISQHFNVSADRINAWIVNAKVEFINKSSASIGSTLSTMGGVLAATVLAPVYIFMILFYQPHLLDFTHKLFGQSNDNDVTEILTQTKSIIKSYLVGLFAEFIIISVLNSIGLLILGIDYAILLGIIGALLNVIPLVGGVICVILFVMIALITKSAIYVLYVVGLYALIQFIDNHYIFPKIVGSKVKLNALISIIAVIAGNALWGIPGMFLSIPLIAITKLIFDHIGPLKPWGFLLGDIVTTSTESHSIFTFKAFKALFHSKKPSE